MKTPTFFDVLREEIRRDVLKELEIERLSPPPQGQEIRHAQLRHEHLATWLAVNLRPGLNSDLNARPGTGANGTVDTSGAGPAKARQMNKKTQAFRAHASASSAHSRPSQDPGQNVNPATSPAVKTSESPAEEAIMETWYQAQTSEEICAIRVLKSYDSRLEARFSEKQLKSAWRTAALNTHPDRYAQASPSLQAKMAARFNEVTVAFEILTRIKALESASPNTKAS